MSVGSEVTYLKPHGALQSRAVLEGSGDLPVLGLPGSVFLRVAADAGRSVHLEGFPDREYTPAGTLVPRCAQFRPGDEVRFRLP